MDSGVSVTDPPSMQSAGETMIRKHLTKALLLSLCAGLFHSAQAADSTKVRRIAADTDRSIDTIVLGMGCFWGAEKRMSALPGVVDVENGYANGEVEASYNAIHEQEMALRSGRSTKRNYAEVVKVSFDPARIDLQGVLAAFWENHDPTQGDRQGNDIGSNYRSAVYTHDAQQRAIAEQTRAAYQQALTRAGYGEITTEIAPLQNYRRAEDYHQDYLFKHPNGYCGLGGTGVHYPGRMHAEQSGQEHPVLDGKRLNFARQLVVFEAEECAYCKAFKADILDHWDRDIAIERTLNPQAPIGWKLAKKLIATPTIVLFEQGTEVARYTGYNGKPIDFWRWLNAKI
jgi:peptide methionine sulfoxide reductase msrA/msrB